ncbi:protein preY, mitochondrial-like [Entelurus aequoreus]|uniref:protein preY, mitochondrial-like n=1 Tax=Entelurus aequoreus TaxID=161455 RepID=UPI002B1E5640|nr:protein preY, mitochondrial-like [Entelurus aequoreus]
MLRSVFVTFGTTSAFVKRSVRHTLLPLTSVSSLRTFTDSKDDTKTFDSSLLDFLVCPLSKKTLRFDEKTNELINDELGIAYPIIDGIPNMIPQEARLLEKTSPAQGHNLPS